MYVTSYALNNINCHQSLFNPSVSLQVKSEQTGEPYYFTKETCLPTRLFTTIFSKVVMDISCTFSEIRSVIGCVNRLDSQSDGGWIIEQRETLLTDHYFGQPVCCWLCTLLSWVQYATCVDERLLLGLSSLMNFTKWTTLNSTFMIVKGSSILIAQLVKSSTSFILVYLLMMRIVVNYSLSSSLKVNIAH